MLQAIRENTKGWIAGFIVVLLAIPFALWGIGNYFSPQPENWVATVNGEEIDQRDYQQQLGNYRQRMRSMMGQEFDPELFDQPEFRREFLENLVREEVLVQASNNAGFTVPGRRVAQEIAGYQAFQVSGQFDGEQYRRSLQRIGMTPDQFERRVREGLKAQIIPGALRQTELVTDSEIDTLVRLQNQTRSFDYFLIDPAPFREDVSVSDDEIREYYETNNEVFMTPERVSIRFVELDASDLADDIEVDEQTLETWFEENRSSYLTAEQRLTSHILIELPDNASQGEIDAARRQAEEAASRARSGEDFAEVAREMSDDAGSAQTGGDLGWVERGQMADAFEQALFSLEEGGISDPVQTGYGFHVIQLRDVQEPRGRTFAQARDQVAEDFKEAEAERFYLEQADRLVNLTYENPGSLEPAARALDLEVRTAGPFTREGGEGIASERKVIQAAFSDLVLEDRVNSDPVDLGPNHIAVLRVDEHMEPRLRPLEEVRDGIHETLVTQKAEAAAASHAASLAEALRSGEGDLAVLAERDGREPVSAEAVTRNAAEHPRGLLEEVFRLEAPGTPPAYHAVSAGGGAAAVVALRDIQPGDPGALSDLERQQLRQQLAQGYVNAATIALVESLKKKAEVRIAEDRL